MITEVTSWALWNVRGSLKVKKQTIMNICELRHNFNMQKIASNFSHIVPKGRNLLSLVSLEVPHQRSFYKVWSFST